MSIVLLWQPSDCIDLFVIDHIFVLFSEVNVMMMISVLGGHAVQGF